MAATSSTTLPQCCNGPGIDGCYLDTDPPSSHPLLVNLRVFFNPTQNLALIRMRTAVSASREPLFLDISPDRIQSLSFVPGPPTYLCFCVTRIILIAPQEPLPRPVTKEDQAALEALRMIAQQSAVRVLLPDGGYEKQQLVALCEAVGRGGLRPDPTQTNLQSLYRGKGGRIIEHGEELWPPPSLFSTVAQPGDLLPPPNLSSTARGDELPPYSNLASDPPPPPPLSPPPVTNKKRRRTRTPSLSPSSSSPDYRTWKHLDLACGEREKMMCELLRRVAKKEKSMRDLMNDLDAREAVVVEKVADLTALLAEVRQKEAALREAAGMQSAEKGRERAQGPGSPEASTASPSRSLTSTVSVSSNISDRVQTYVTTQIDRLRDEIACEYATSDEVDLVLSRHVDEDQMFEAIREAIDEALAGVRARMMEAWE